MKILKVVRIEATFPQLRGGVCHQTGKGQGSTVAAAMGAAVRNLVKQKGLKAQRYTQFTATFSIGTIKEGPEETPCQTPS